MPMKGAVATLLVTSLAVGPAAVWGFNTAFLRDTPVVYFSDKDVVRHKLVQMIIKAYETHTKKSEI